MNIAVNTRLLIQNKLEGIGWFSYEVLKRLTRSHSEHHFFFIFDRNFNPDFIFSDNITPIVAPPKARHPFLFYYWFEKVIPSILLKNNIDLFFSPDGYLSLASKIKSLPVIHDLNFIHRPTDLPLLVRKYYNHFFPKFAHKAFRIITVSNYSKQDICNTLKVSPDKIDVVFNGVNDNFRQLSDTEKKDVKIKYSKGHEYFIYVGSLHKRKNIINLLKSFDSFKKQGKSNYQLIIVGEKLFQDNNMVKTYQKLVFKNDILFTGRVSSIELAKLLGTAYALIFVPFFEGFGLPVIEAMACGVPVIASDSTSLPEVAGDAALYAHPDSIDSIVEKMNILISDKNIHNSLKEKGIKRSEKFSWDETARLVWNSIEKTMSEK